MVHWLGEEWRGFEEMEGEKGDSIDMSVRISSTAAIISATAWISPRRKINFHTNLLHSQSRESARHKFDT